MLAKPVSLQLSSSASSGREPLEMSGTAFSRLDALPVILSMVSEN